MMGTIAIDMFPVGLGSAMLVELDPGDDQPIRILADGGVGHGVAVTMVRDRLAQRWPRGQLIDLLVGTHYDADHLKGLVPVVAHPSFDIGEAWLPPVRDARTDELLGKLFARDEDGSALQRHLRDQADKIAQVEGAAGQLAERFSIEREAGRTAPFADRALGEEDFLGYEDPAADGHRDEDEPIDRRPLPLRIVTRLQDMMGEAWKGEYGFAPSRAEAAKALLELDILKSRIASGAITAIHLHKLVRALVAKGVAMRFPMITKGKPKRYGWSRAERRFSVRAKGDAILIDLLGPSNWLAAKHGAKLPRATAQLLAYMTSLPLEGITPSNQLSLIFRLEAFGEGMLLTGDSGCSDWPVRQGTRTYHGALLRKLDPLAIVQVSHHGGRSHHFFPVLQAARVERRKITYLVSQDAASKVRPGDAFRDYCRGVARNGSTILFTEPPRRSLSRPIVPLIGARTGPGEAVSLRFSQGRWRIADHPVDVGALPR
ncbi:hypothetical protein [Sphingomicrobium nitratireducens]|uniref:hypothetical protein n=1 Tax=Sphingomicrobium nitratireducens TaxID=2964666 RepID=UPI0022404E18|nr:hypothetical protein [Sphingomicrobium nitratireducens]